MVYHPGLVLNVFPAEGKQGETAATVKFWDSNLHTVKVSSEIANTIRQGDMVLVDYYPISDRLNRPRMVATKMVDKKHSKELWSHYQGFLKMKKKAIMAKKKAEEVTLKTPPRSNVGIG